MTGARATLSEAGDRDSHQRIRSHCLEECGAYVACKTGRRDVGVSGGGAEPVAAPNASLNVLLAGNRLRISAFVSVI